MYGLMVVFEPTRATPLARGSNIGLNFGNVVAESEGTANGYPGSGGGAVSKLDCW